MTRFELAVLAAEPFLPVLRREVRRRLLEVVRDANPRPRILDVGGRSSPYTVGVPADVTVLDLPRRTGGARDAVREELHLGIDRREMESLLRRRSNVRQVVLEDMIGSSLPDGAFDVVVAVEVLEHVERDRTFLGEVARVLRPRGGFLLTTPNGEFVPRRNPDHVRHYTREELRERMEEWFDDVDVRYAVATGRWRSRGLTSWSPRRPVATVLGMIGNVINGIQSRRPGISERAVGTHHLVATARGRS